MPEQELKISVENRFSELDTARVRMRGYLEEHDVSPQALYNAELVLEEVLTNAIKYGYQDSADHRIELEVAASHDEIAMRFVDDGIAFDPSCPPPAQRPGTIQEVKIGGLGLILIRSACRQLTYARKAGKNHLLVTIANK